MKILLKIGTNANLSWSRTNDGAFKLFFCRDSSNRMRRQLCFLKLATELNQRSRRALECNLVSFDSNSKSPALLEPVQTEQIDVGTAVDVLIHFHCFFSADRKRIWINFCATTELLRVTLLSIQSPEGFSLIQETIFTFTGNGSDRYATLLPLTISG